MKFLEMTWEEYQAHLASNELRTGKYEAVGKIEILWIGTVTDVDRMTTLKVRDMDEGEVIMEVHTFQLMYEKYEELKERRLMEDHTAMSSVWNIYDTLLRFEQHNRLYDDQIRLMITDRYEQEWGTYYKNKALGKQPIPDEITAEWIVEEARRNVTDQEV